MMALSYNDSQTLLMRLRAQRLIPQPPGRNAEQVVKEICGLQAQELPAANLGVRVRSLELTVADVDRARLSERSIVRTWGPRGTLHLLAADDLDWLLPLLGPVFIAPSSSRYRQLGLEEETSNRGVRLIREALASQGPQTRHELARMLGAHGLPGEGQAPYHLIHQAALEGLVCQGPERDGEPAYVLLEDWIGPLHPVPQETAQAELARRYLQAFAPAGPQDLASWSGIHSGEARSALERIASQLIEVKAAGRSAWMLKEQAGWLDELPTSNPIVRLLPGYDAYLLGYASRDLALAPEHARRIHPGGGVLRPALLVDGRILGTWRSPRRRDRLEVSVERFEDLDPGVRPALEADVEDLARFLSEKASLNLIDEA